MTGRPGRPQKDDTKTSNVSPVPAGQEDAAEPAAAPRAANEGDATNPQTDRAAADTEEKPEPTRADKPAAPEPANADKPAAPESTSADKPAAPESTNADKPAAPEPAAAADEADSKPDTPGVAAPDGTDTDEPSVDWEARANAAEKELADLKLKVAAQNAAAEAGLPPEAAQFLRGDSDEEIKAAAETLASLITPTSPLDRNPVPRGQEPDDRPDLATIGARLFRN